jgi:hypothetical protein
MNDVEKGRYWIETGICKDCYFRLQRSSVEISCFGKAPTTKTFGYDRKHIACNLLCPDKTVCPQFVKISKKENG